MSYHAKIARLEDVALEVSIANLEILSYQSSTGKWINRTASELGFITLDAGTTQGQLAIWNASSSKWTYSNNVRLVSDSTTNIDLQNGGAHGFHMFGVAGINKVALYVGEMDFILGEYTGGSPLYKTYLPLLTTNGYVKTQNGTGELYISTSAPGVSVSNQADNRIITATGTTDALYAESYLTFNGTTLQLVNGSSNKAVNIHSGDTGANAPYISIIDGRDTINAQMIILAASSTNFSAVEFNFDDGNDPIPFLRLFNYTTPSSTIDIEIGDGTGNYSPSTLSLMSFGSRIMRLDLNATYQVTAVGGIDWTSNVFYMGADSASSMTRTNSTVKHSKYVSAHYLNAEEPFMGMLCSSGINYSSVYIGGGSSSFNAATIVGVFVASDYTTVAGTQVINITSSQTNIINTLKVSNAYTLPTGLGTDNYVLTTHGDGTTTWEAPSSGGVTINDNVSTYVVTATGVANTLDGEPKLRFGSDTLTIDGLGVECSADYGTFYRMDTASDTENPEIRFYRSGGVLTARDPLATDDIIGNISFLGYDKNSSFVETVKIEVIACAGWDGGDTFSKFRISTYADDNAGSLQERFLIDCSGVINFYNGAYAFPTAAPQSPYDFMIFPASGNILEWTNIEALLTVNDGIFDLTLSNGLSVSPYSNQTTGAFDSSSTNPSGSTRLNWNGNFYATNLISARDVECGDDDSYYLGPSATNGTWRITRSGNNLVIERRESGSYVTKQTISA